MSHRVPNELKRALGNPGKRAIPEPLTVLPAASEPPEPPVSFSGSGAAEWERVWRAGAVWLSPDTDVWAVVRWCQTFDEVAELVAVLDRDGRFVESARGGPTEHPASKTLRFLRREQFELARELGFTPRTRSALGLAEVSAAEKASKLSVFFVDEDAN